MVLSGYDSTKENGPGEYHFAKPVRNQMESAIGIVFVARQPDLLGQHQEEKGNLVQER
jgi:hypothetical protein